MAILFTSIVNSPGRVQYWEDAAHIVVHLMVVCSLVRVTLLKVCCMRCVQNMVMTFRVSELQLLLGLTNQSKCGRKTELLQRALGLIDRGVSAAVQMKIREIFRKYTPPQRAVLGTGYNVCTQQSMS